MVPGPRAGIEGILTPVIGFTVCYAISNVLLAVCEPIIVFVVAG